MKDITLWLIRHGQTPSNEQSLTIGQSAEEPLTELGIEQAKCLGTRLRKEVVFDKCFVSSYTRAYETYKHAAPKINGECITGVEALREIDRGDARGMTIKDLHNNHELWASYRRNGMGFAFSNGESAFDVAHRARTYLNEELLTSPHTRTDKPLQVGVFSHGLTIKALLWSILNNDHRMTGRIEILNTAISKVRLKNNEWFVLSINDTAHLSA